MAAGHDIDLWDHRLGRQRDDEPAPKARSNHASARRRHGRCGLSSGEQPDVRLVKGLTSECVFDMRPRFARTKSGVDDGEKIEPELIGGLRQ